MSAIGSRLRRLEGGQPQPPSPERWPYSGGSIFMARATTGTPVNDTEEAFAAAGCTAADLRILFVGPSLRPEPVVAWRHESRQG